VGLRPEKEMQIIAVEDIAVFVALAFENPKEFLYKTIELSGDELTEAQIVETLSNVIGRPVNLVAPTAGGGGWSEDERVAAFNFFNGEGYDADIPSLRKLHPGLLRLEQYLRKNGWENQQPIPLPENAAWGS